ncbi:FAD-dependent urate hydroxylase HpxO [Acerihabitans arboris]|uniref:FAD-dependent urate hydroxylase n=1 Tax=Acerihabitans arboris TaxID=2691583 RepID=A0A845SJ69_9GAMM|nr:FAD-dependent urate hydroxylase HpxO [Acerihabitans arboris]NDL62681.1 FAD-dependent urate hydroxylase HpxO [Acerihabitans arboris]
MKAIVIGAGMGGASAGIALRNFGWQTEIYEAVAQVKPVGAAISIWPNGVKCLNFLGLQRQIKAIGGDMASMAYQDYQSGQILTRFPLRPLVDRVGEFPYPTARAELQSMLLDEFGRGRVFLNKRLIQLEDNGSQVTAGFADGSTATGDLLIGADGTHSMVRRHVLGHDVKRRYAGYVNWNGLVEIDEAIAPANQWTTFVGQGKRVSLMPVAGRRFYYFFDVPLPTGLKQSRDTSRKDLKRYFTGWCAPVQRLIEQLDPMATNRVEIHDIEPFSTLVRGRVALLGDAAHSTTPDIGQGGCAAMEDAVVLSLSLRAHSLGVEDALRRYQESRVERVTSLVLKARKRCDVTHGKDPLATRQWYHSLEHETGEHILNGMAETILGGPL